MAAKEIRVHTDARERMLRGIDILSNAVRVTLGPKGRNVDAAQHPLARIGMKPDLLCRHSLLPSRSLLRRSLFDHAHNVTFLRDDEILAVDFDLGARPFPEQHSVADFDIERAEVAVIAPGAGPSGNDFAFHWLFLGGVGDDNTACCLLLLLDSTDEDAILQRSKFHWVPPSVSNIPNARLAPRAIGARIESDVRGFKLSSARTSAYWDRLHGGTDPERDEKFESVLLSGESAKCSQTLGHRQAVLRL